MGDSANEILKEDVEMVLLHSCQDKVPSPFNLTVRHLKISKTTNKINQSLTNILTTGIIPLEWTIAKISFFSDGCSLYGNTISPFVQSHFWTLYKKMPVK
jgi:hypothetical protein